MVKLEGIGVAWYRAEDWPRWRDIDPTIESDYAKWLRASESASAQLTAGGLRLVRVTLDPDEFLTWSNLSAGGRVDTGARTEFAAIKLMRQDTGH